MSGGTNNLNINLPDNNAVLRLEVELRDKNQRRRANNNQMRNKGFGGGGGGGGGDRKRTTSSSTSGAVGVRQPPLSSSPMSPSSINANNFFVPMEKVSIYFLFALFGGFFLMVIRLFILFVVVGVVGGGVVVSAYPRTYPKGSHGHRKYVCIHYNVYALRLMLQTSS